MTMSIVRFDFQLPMRNTNNKIIELYVDSSNFNRSKDMVEKQDCRTSIIICT